MTAAGRWFVTPHARDRYIQLTGGAMSFEGALTRLIAASQTAELRKQLDSGALLYVHVGPGPRWRYVVQVPSEPGLLPQLVTVRPPYDGWTAPACPGNAREAAREAPRRDPGPQPPTPRQPRRRKPRPHRVIEVVIVRRYVER